MELTTSAIKASPILPEPARMPSFLHQTSYREYRWKVESAHHWLPLVVCASLNPFSSDRPYFNLKLAFIIINTHIHISMPVATNLRVHSKKFLFLSVNCNLICNDFSGSPLVHAFDTCPSILTLGSVNRNGERKKESIQIQHSAAVKSVFFQFLYPWHKIKQLQISLYIFPKKNPLSCDMKANQNWLYVVAMGTYLLANTHPSKPWRSRVSQT